MRKSFRFSRPSFIAAVASLITLVGWGLSSRSVELYNSTRFKTLSNDLEEDISYRIQTYVNALAQTQGMVAVSPYLSRTLFKEYFQYINFESQYPGLQGIGIIERISRVNLRSHIAQAKSEGFSDFAIHPKNPRSEYFSVINIEPMNAENRKSMGYDMFTDPVMKAAMIKARDSGRPALSGKVIVGKDQPGFIIFAPIYKNKSSLKTELSRQKNLVGFIFSSFQAKPFFASIFGRVRDSFPIDFEVYLSHDIQRDSLVYDHDGHPSFLQERLDSSFKKKKLITLAGQDWTILTYSLPVFEMKSYSWIPLMVLFAGVMIACLLYWIMDNHWQQAERESELYEKAQEAVASRDEFISIASHELKTPLSTLKLQVQSFSRILQKSAEAPEFKERTLKVSTVINGQVGRLTELIDNLLDVSRARAGRLILSKSSMNVVEIIKEVVERQRTQFTLTQTKISISSPDEIFGNFDRLRIEQIAENLLSNALKYAPGKPVKVALEVVDEHLVFTVADLGDGINEENQKKIFERFERVSETSQKVSGLGLGLFITKQIIEAHGGSISVQSQVGQGTTFTVKLPIDLQSFDEFPVGMNRVSGSKELTLNS